MSWYQSDVNYTPPEPYIPPDWSTGTDEEIAEAIEQHYLGNCDLTEYWSVGDERTVSLSAMSATGVGESHAAQDVVFVLSNVGGKYLSDGVTECAFQVDMKHCLNEEGYMNSTQTNVGGWKSSARRTWCNNVYKNAIPETLRGIFKEFINQSGLGASYSGVEDTTDYFALRAEIEVFGYTTYSVSGEGSQVKWYETSANIKKMVNGGYKEWWERSTTAGGSQIFCSVSSDGNAYAGSGANYRRWIAPFGVI